jgi:hypothetical protein
MGDSDLKESVASRYERFAGALDRVRHEGPC